MVMFYKIFFKKSINKMYFFYKEIIFIFKKTIIMIIAFSGPWNTWKSYIIQQIKKEYSFKYTYYNEIAREILEKEKNLIPKKFQELILKEEMERIDKITRLKEKNPDINLIIDRTFIDNIVYLYWNIIYWKVEGIFDFYQLNEYIEKVKKVYDKVILFNSPFKESKKFEDYNSKRFNLMLIETIKETFPDNKIEEYKNSYDFIKNNKIFKLK